VSHYAFRPTYFRRVCAAIESLCAATLPSISSVTIGEMKLPFPNIFANLYHRGTAAKTWHFALFIPTPWTMAVARDDPAGEFKSIRFIAFESRISARSRVALATCYRQWYISGRVVLSDLGELMRRGRGG